MKNTSPSRILSLLDVTTNLILLFWIFLLIGVTGLLIISQFESNSGGAVSLDWPVLFSEHIQNNFNDDNLDKYARPHDSDFGSLNQLSAVLSPRTSLWPYYSLFSYLSLIFKSFLIAGVVYLIRNIILDIKQQKPFTQQNTHRLKAIAWLIFCMFPYAMLDSLISHWYIINYVEMIDLEFVSQIFTRSTFAQNGLQENQILLLNKHSFTPVIYALTVYVIAVIFTEGLKLKEDNESIV
jgi:hypothetical protein